MFQETLPNQLSVGSQSEVLKKLLKLLSTMFNAYFSSPKHQIANQCTNFVCIHVIKFHIHLHFSFEASWCTFCLSLYCTCKITLCKIRRPCGLLNWSMVTNPHQKFLTGNTPPVYPKWGGALSCCQATLLRSWGCLISETSVFCRHCR